MNSLKKMLFLKNAVKDGFDNLPSGICFFSKNGIAVMCNFRMTRLIYSMAGHDLQCLSELIEMLDEPETSKGAVRDGSCFILPDGKAWRFSISKIVTEDGNHYTEAVASDVTSLREKQSQLSSANEAKRQTVAALERIQKNVVAITREEEILSMKMKLHNEFGYNLQTIRCFYQHGCPADERAAFLSGQKEIIRKMRGELGSEDSVDPLTELRRLAASLDMELIITGAVPDRYDVHKLLTFALRECLMNTCCHAKGNTVFAELKNDGRSLTVCVTNNGEQPGKDIVEGGGLSALRTRIEKAGGTMIVRGQPEFKLTATIPLTEDT